VTPPLAWYTSASLGERLPETRVRMNMVSLLAVLEPLALSTPPTMNAAFAV
jgi:hypothetical protein